MIRGDYTRTTECWNFLSMPEGQEVSCRLGYLWVQAGWSGGAKPADGKRFPEFEIAFRGRLSFIIYYEFTASLALLDVVQMSFCDGVSAASVCLSVCPPVRPFVCKHLLLSQLRKDHWVDFLKLGQNIPLLTSCASTKKKKKKKKKIRSIDKNRWFCLVIASLQKLLGGFKWNLAIMFGSMSSCTSTKNNSGPSTNLAVCLVTFPIYRLGIASL